MASSSPSSHQALSKHYDVFISFRGEDTRRTFADLLFAALSRNDISTFFDDEFSTEVNISSSILRAIEGSTISVIIFSENYAGSKLCLMELEKILECKRSNGQTVIPVFYGVDPSHVRNQTGGFGAALARLEERLREEETMDVDKIRYNLRKAGSMSGFKSDFRDESYIVEEIVGDVLNKLSQGRLHYFPQAGIFTHLVRIILHHDINDVLGNVLRHFGWFELELMTPADEIHEVEGLCSHDARQLITMSSDNVEMHDLLREMQELMPVADEIHEVEGLSSHDARQLITMPLLREMAYSIIDDGNRRRVYGWSPQIPPKVVLNWIFPLTNLVLEILLLTLDQIASAQKPLYGLMGLVVAYSAMLVCVGELVYKGWTRKISLKRQGMRCWIQYPRSDDRPLFSWLDVFSLACAIAQIVFSTFGYSYLQQNKDNPIKVSIVSLIYIICLVAAKISNNPIEEGLPVVLNYVFPLTNLALESVVLTLEIIGSAQKPLYNLIALIVAWSAMMGFLGELVYRGRHRNITLMWNGMIWKIKKQLSDHRPFFTWSDAFSLLCAICQLVSTTVGYSYSWQHKENPFKVSLVPLIYIICMAASNCQQIN